MNVPDEKFQKTIPIFYFDEERKSFQIVVKLKNNPGSLASLLNVLAKQEINILTSVDYAQGDSGIWIGFVQAKDDKLTTQKLESIARSSPTTISVKTSESINGFLIDNLTFPFARLNGDRDVIIRAEFLRDMMRKLRDEFGSAADVFLYKEGIALEESAEKFYIDRYGAEKLFHALTYFQSFYSALGWAKPELVFVDPPGRKATLRLYESFECSKENGNKPYSHFLRGFINGSFSTMMGAKTSTREVLCQAKGDPCCEFLVTEAV